MEYGARERKEKKMCAAVRWGGPTISLSRGSLQPAAAPASASDDAGGPVRGGVHIWSTPNPKGIHNTPFDLCRLPKMHLQVTHMACQIAARWQGAHPNGRYYPIPLHLLRTRCCSNERTSRQFSEADTSEGGGQKRGGRRGIKKKLAGLSSGFRWVPFFLIFFGLVVSSSALMFRILCMYGCWT